MDFAVAAEKIQRVFEITGWRNYRFGPFTSSAICLGIAIGEITFICEQDRMDLTDKVASIIREQYPDRTCIPAPAMSQIVYFNDAQATTREDIDLVLAKLAVA